METETICRMAYAERLRAIKQSLISSESVLCEQIARNVQRLFIVGSEAIADSKSSKPKLIRK